MTMTSALAIAVAVRVPPRASTMFPVIFPLSSSGASLRRSVRRLPPRTEQEVSSNCSYSGIANSSGSCLERCTG